MDRIMEVEAQIEIEYDADKFFRVWCQNTNLIAKMSPHRILKVELIKGIRNNWHAQGSIITWTYVSPIDGKLDFVTTKVEETNESMRSVSYKAIDGSIVKKFYKTLRSHLEVTPTGIDRSIVKLRLEYEKMHEDVPDPNIFADFGIGCAKDISDAHRNQSIYNVRNLI